MSDLPHFTPVLTRHWAITVLVGLLGVSFVGCADFQLPTTDARIPLASRVATIPTNEQSALQEITRAVALALGNPGIRMKVLTDMQQSRVREHKLDFNSYLSGQLGQQLLNAAAAATARTPSDLLVLVNRIRPLEFYMPVAAHRRTWQGGGEVLVAAQLKADDTPVGFSVSGESVALSPTHAPNAPTLALVPVETDFAQQQAVSTPNGIRVPSKRASFSIEPPPDCDPATQSCTCTSDCVQPPAGIPTTAPSGLYMTFSDLYDAAEPWIKGSPEVEAHILGPELADAPTLARQISCSGEHASGWKSFDQNANQWGGVVLLLSEQEMVSRGYTTGATEHRGFSVVLYEDDDQSCVIHDDGTRLGYDFIQTAMFAGTGVAVAAGCGGWVCVIGDALVDGFATIYYAIQLFETNDDYLGVAVPRANAPQYTNGLATHTLIKHANAINGGIKLVYHVYGQ